MFKRMISLLMALTMILFSLSALAEGVDAPAQDQTGDALTMDELETWVEGYKARALQTQPLNNPNDPAAFSEDGYAFIYDFATLYMDSPVMSEDSVVRNLVVTDAMEEGPRGTHVDMQPAEVLSAFYNENESLVGDRGFAVLYLSDMMPTGAAWAWVQRDGQRLMAIQYAVQEQAATGADGYTDAGLIYTLQDNLVAAIRAYGLDSRVSGDDVLDSVYAVKQVLDASDYVQVPASVIGTDLDAFDADDLIFAGMDFLSLTPDNAGASLGACLEDDWMDDDNGEYVRTMQFANCEVSFIYDGQKQNPVIDLMSIDTDSMEGPRAVRIGDSFSSVLTRFRHSEGVFDGVSTETLYGAEGQAAWGVANYGDDASATLRYGLRLADGREVVLYMTFDQMSLSEVLIYIND